MTGLTSSRRRPLIPTVSGFSTASDKFPSSTDIDFSLKQVILALKSGARASSPVAALVRGPCGADGATPSPLLWGKVPSKARRMRGIERSEMALIGQHD